MYQNRAFEVCNSVVPVCLLCCAAIGNTRFQNFYIIPNGSSVPNKKITSHSPSPSAW